MRKINLENLPRCGDQIDWKKSIGYSVEFIYDDIIGVIKIIDYDVYYKKITTKYLNNEPYQIKIDNFSRCQLGFAIGVISNKHKHNIGDIINGSQNRSITITDQITMYNGNHNIRGYKYVCNVCSYCGEISENHLNSRNGSCPCCCGQKVMEGFNDFKTNYPQLVKYFKNQQECNNLPCQTMRKVELKCPDCGTITLVSVANFVKVGKFNCSKCSDGLSYPNKFMFNFLEQLNIEFEPEKVFSWLKSRRYDFYISSINCIIEAHGKQHYVKGRSFPIQLEEQQKIDEEKHNLALKNGIDHYIEIDCSVSDLDFIKNNILNSKINEFFDLSNIDWIKCNKYSVSSLLKSVCEYKRDNPNSRTGDISKFFKISKNTTTLYLKTGNKIWDWVKYNAEQERIDCIKRKEIPVEVYKDGKLLGTFDSKVKLQDVAESIFGVKMNKSSVVKSIKLNIPHNGYTFKNVK